MGELHREVTGAGDPVVLVHGGSLDSRMWDGQVATLAGRHTVIRYDLRGHGRSPTPTERFAHHVDLRDLLADLRVDHAAVVGLSMGARIAVDLALAYPDLVDRLVLASPGVSGTAFTDPFVLAQLAQLTQARADGDTHRAVEHILRMWVDGPHRTPDDVAPEARALCRELTTETVTRHGRAGVALADELNASTRTHELRVPTLVLTGDLDNTDVHRAADLFPHAARRTLPAAGHMLNLEQPGAFNRAVLDFLADRPQ